MTHPDPTATGAQPGTPEGAWAPQQGVPQGTPQGAPQESPRKSGAKKWLPIAGAVAVAGVVGAGSLTGWFGSGPQVGDCVQMQGQTSFDVVDCGGGEAEYTIVGVHDEEMAWPDFEEAASVDEVCQDFQTWEVALWIGDLETEPGTIYCSEPA